MLPGRLPDHHVEEFAGRDRLAEEPPLPVLAAAVHQEVPLLIGLDALRHDLQTETAAHLDDGANDRGVIRVARRIAYERLVDFERADRELLQRAQARV